MVRRNIIRGMTLAIAAGLLVACAAPQGTAPRIELPQQIRLPQNDLATLLERRSGKIAIVDSAGNIVITDQTGRSTTNITREANAGAESSRYVTAYNWPMWSPDASKLAFVEVVARRPDVSAVIEYGVEEIIVRRGDDSQTVIFGAQGQLTRSAPNTQYRVQRPGRVVIEPESSTGELVYSALYIADATGKAPRVEVYATENGRISYLDWSPDGSRLAFAIEDVETGRVNVNIVASSGAAQQSALRLFDGASAAWHWTPDSSALLARVRPAGQNALPVLSLLDANGDKRPTVLSSGSALAFFSPQFSPDGRQILTTVEDNARAYLALADSQGKLIRRLTGIEGAVSFAWSPRGTQAAYITRQSASQAGGVLRLVDVNTGEDKALSTQPVVGFFWSPDGSRIAAFSPMQPADITPDLPGIDYTPSQPENPLMLQTIDVNTRNARQLAYFEPTEQFRALIARFDRSGRSANIWSPDSTKLVFPVRVTTARGQLDVILETEATGSVTPRFIGQGTLAFWSPR